MNWSEFTSIPNGTRVYNHGYDQCVALFNLFHEDVLGGAFVPVGSAYQLWDNFGSYSQLTSKYRQSSTPVAGAVFIGRYGIYQAANGHVGVVTSVNGNGTFNTMEQNAGTWRYVGRYTRGMANISGFLIPINNPAQQPVAANQRQVGANVVKRRQGPSTSSAELPDPLQPGTIGNFDGWIYGEQVNDGVANTNVWYRGTSGNFFWAGGFTKVSGEGLTDLNPVVPPAGNERIVGANPARRRQDATTAAAELTPALSAGQKVLFDGWKTGQAISDSIASTAIWYHHSEGWWAWAGAFTQISTLNLKDMNAPVPPAPEPPVPPAPEPPVPPAPEPPTPGRKPVSETTPNWDMTAPAANPIYPVPTAKATGVKLPGTIVERAEAVSVEGYTIGRVDPLGPNHIVLHHAATTSLDGAVNTLRGTTGAPTASYVVKDDQLVSMVPEGSSPWTNGRWTSNMYSVTFEMVNESQTGTTWNAPSKATCETTAWAMARAAQRWNIELPLEHGINVFGHKEVSKSATACPGLLDVDAVVKRANEIIAANPVPSPEPTPSVDTVAIAGHLDTVVTEITAISNILKGNK